VIFFKTLSRLPVKGPMFWRGGEVLPVLGATQEMSIMGAMYIMVVAAKSTSSSSSVGSCRLLVDLF
jgi:hypothetical protein